MSKARRGPARSAGSCGRARGSARGRRGACWSRFPTGLRRRRWRGRRGRKCNRRRGCRGRGCDGGHRLGGRERGEPLARGLTRPFARSPFLRGGNRSLKARARRRCLAFALEREAFVGQRRRIVGVEAHRLVEVGDGAVVLMLVEPGEAAIEEGHRIVRIEPQRLTKSAVAPSYSPRARNARPRRT